MPGYALTKSEAREAFGWVPPTERHGNSFIMELKNLGITTKDAIKEYMREIGMPKESSFHVVHNDMTNNIGSNDLSGLKLDDALKREQLRTMELENHSKKILKDRGLANRDIETADNIKAVMDNATDIKFPSGNDLRRQKGTQSRKMGENGSVQKNSKTSIGANNVRNQFNAVKTSNHSQNQPKQAQKMAMSLMRGM